MKYIQYRNFISLVKSAFIVVLFLCFYHSSLSQNNNQPFEKLSIQLDSLSHNHAAELIYLQTSKGIYETGEDLWFKAYILNAQYLTPSALSQTLYLQLLNTKNLQPVWQEKYEINNGFSDGHVFINDTLSEGNYLLAAYTQHSFSKNQSYFKYIRKIVVKKDLKPRVTVTAEFSQTSFGKGDSIAVTVLALNEQQKPQFAQIVATLQKDGKELEKLQTQTQADGKAFFRFNPARTSTGLTVKIATKHSKSTENISLAVPFHKGCPIQFEMFPEGGNLFNGLESKVAFKAVNRNGLPEETSGILFENGDTLLKFNSSHNGMGSFSFLPDVNKRYRTKLIHPKTDSIFVLPEILPNGITLQLAKRDSFFLWFKVFQSPDMPETKIYFRGQSRGVVYCMASGTLKNELDLKIPIDQFPLQGITEFTLFSSELQPLAERLVYVNPDNKLNIEVKLSKEKYSTREKVSIDLKVTDKNGVPVIANLGATLFDKIYSNNNDKKNILTHCHLFSQLKGKVFDPSYYFNKENKDRMEKLDLLLLTQGWRKYVWNENLLKGVEKEHVIKDGVDGKLIATKKTRKALIDGQLIMAYNPGVNEDSEFIITNTEGDFYVTPQLMAYWQGENVYLKPMGPEEFGYKLNLEDPFDSINNEMLITKSIYPTSKITGNEKSQTREFVPGPNIIELDEVTVKGKTRVQFRDKYLGQLDSITKLDLNDHWVCPHGFLHNYKPGYAHLVGSSPPYRQCCPDSLRTKPTEGEGYQLVKYESVGRADGNWTLTDIYSIVYHYPKYTEEELLKMNNLYRIQGYYAKREFYQPNYDKKEQQNMIPDYRNTLLWEPMILTNENGEATIEFFCSDIYTGFTGIIEGLNGSGQLGYKEFEFTVRKTKRFEWEK